MKHLDLFLVLAASGACLAACSAGSAVGGGGGPDGTGAANSSGGSGSTKGAGGSGSGPAAGGTSGKGGSAPGSGGTGNTGNTSGTSGTSGSTGGSMVGQVLDCPNGAQLGSPAFRLMTRTEFDNTINDIFPSVKGMWTDSLPANITVASGFDNDAGAVVGNQMASNLLDTALSIATAVTGSGLQNILSCAANKDHACAKTYLDQTGARLFRRALTDAEETRYLTLFDTGLAASDFPTALKWVTVGLIQSPNSIYRSEIGTVQADGTRKLTSAELATELAYTFSGTTPTADLLAQFQSNPNTDPVATATSLLQTANGQEVMQHFFEEYLTYTGTAAITRTLTDPPPQTNLDFPIVAADMLQETRDFVSNVVLTGGSISDLLTSNKTYPSANLAKYYGFPAPGSDGSVTRPAGEGVGILVQGSFLSTHANSGYSSPTQRGLFPYYRLMCQPKLTVPNGVPAITDNDTQAAKTTRELYETTHLAGNTSCKSCHSFFDPIGFGFENFDQGGRYRTQQKDSQGSEQQIDPSGQVIDPNGNVIFTFKTQEELAQKLAAQLESSECFSAYMATYAFGSTDPCLGPSSAEGLNKGSTSIVKAFAALASEKNFTQRNGQ